MPGQYAADALQLEINQVLITDGRGADVTPVASYDFKRKFVYRDYERRAWGTSQDRYIVTVP